MQKTISIGNKKVGEGHSCYVIAEAGVNHNGDIGLALKLVEAAKKTGADCVKFQTYKTERIITKEAPKANYQLKSTSPKESQFEMLKKLELRQEDYPKIMALCKKLKIQFLSTPYNFEDADFLAGLGVDAFKIASGQLVELAFLRHVARYRKPVILSTGMATLAEVYEAVSAIKDEGNDDLIVLQCTTNYPSRAEDANVSAMGAMRDTLGVQVGYSDHVVADYAAYAAVALGACVIEKHFTLDTNMPGPDHKASLNPKGFTELVAGIRVIEKSLGSAVKTPTKAEVENVAAMRRSIVAARNIKKGQVLTRNDLEFKRPATGMPPKMFEALIGKKVARDIKSNELFDYGMISW